MRSRRLAARKYPIDTREEVLIGFEVEDSMFASMEERLAAAAALIQTALAMQGRSDGAHEKDFADFLAALNKEGADYVVIGGIAVQAHVLYRFTRDIDVLIRPTLENARKVRAALAHWAGATPIHTAADFISGDIISLAEFSASRCTPVFRADVRRSLEDRIAPLSLGREPTSPRSMISSR